MNINMNPAIQPYYMPPAATAGKALDAQNPTPVQQQPANTANAYSNSMYQPTPGGGMQDMMRQLIGMLMQMMQAIMGMFGGGQQPNLDANAGSYPPQGGAYAAPQPTGGITPLPLGNIGNAGNAGTAGTINSGNAGNAGVAGTINAGNAGNGGTAGSAQDQTAGAYNPYSVGNTPAQDVNNYQAPTNDNSPAYQAPVTPTPAYQPAVQPDQQTGYGQTPAVTPDYGYIDTTPANDYAKPAADAYQPPVVQPDYQAPAKDAGYPTQPTNNYVDTNKDTGYPTTSKDTQPAPTYPAQPQSQPGDSKENPYKLEGKSVTFDPTQKDGRPQFIEYKGNVYEFKSDAGNKLNYFNGALKSGERNLDIKYTGKMTPGTPAPTTLPPQTDTSGGTGYGTGGGYDTGSSYDSTYPPQPTYDAQPPSYDVNITRRSPLVLDLNGDGINATERNRQFDFGGNGQSDLISSLGKDDATLVFDANNNGKAGETGLEIFGDGTDLNNDGKADGFANGFDALKGFASQKLGNEAVADNQLDAAEIQQLEAQGLGLEVDGQFKTLSGLGISNLNLDFKNSNQVDQFNNAFSQQSTFTQNGQEKGLIDVWYNVGAK